MLPWEYSGADLPRSECNYSQGSKCSRGEHEARCLGGAIYTPLGACLAPSARRMTGERCSESDSYRAIPAFYGVGTLSIDGGSSRPAGRPGRAARPSSR